MKIGIVGDLHILPVPEKRLDDYLTTGLNKITEIASNCDYVIFLGDIFSRAKVDEQGLIRLIAHLNYCTSVYKTKFYTIIGNHDVTNEDESHIDESSLGVLSAAGIITLITTENPVKIGEYTFNTVPVKFKTAKEFLIGKHYTKKDILLIHHEYETGTNCFAYNDFKDLGCHSIYLGHDHKPFDQGRIIYPEFTIYRSGSIMRNRTDDYNFTRTLYYYLLQDENVSCVPVTTLPASSVFKAESVDKLALQERKYTEELDALIDRYEHNVGVQDKYSVRKILLSLNTPQENLGYLDKKYTAIGEILV